MARRRIHWHPLFTRLLRPRVEHYYEVRTDVPVGDLPRQADLVLLRRRETGATPFQSLWRHLTAWNLLEFKGPTDAARPAHLPLLIELGLGIARRLREQGHPGLRRVPEEEIFFWYLARRLGRRFHAEAERRAPNWEALGAGLWRGQVLGHPVFLVSAVEAPLDDDSLPRHVLALEGRTRQRAIAEYVAGTEERVRVFGSVFSGLYPAVWREVAAMARRRRREITFDIRPSVEMLGLAEVIRQIGKEEVIRQIGEEEVIRQIGEEEVIRQIGEEEVIRQIGKEEVIRQIGEKEILKVLAPQTIVASLPPAKRRELKRLLDEAETRR